MSAADAVALAAAVVATIGAVVVLVAAVVLVGQVRRFERGIETLRADAVALVHDARAAAGQASAELTRVEAVLSDTGSVTATVDHATRTAERVFANPVVKVLAWRAGTVGALRRLGQPAVVPAPELRPARRRGAGRDRAGRAVVPPSPSRQHWWRGARAGTSPPRDVAADGVDAPAGRRG